MDERAALLAAVLTDPADDTARLVFADWLEEHGEAALGRFARAGVVAARFRDESLIESRDYYSALAEMAAVAKAGHLAGWLGDLGLAPDALAAGDWGWDSAGDRVTVRLGSMSGVYARGMLAELHVPLVGWFVVAPAAVTTWPLERAAITDVPGLSFLVDRPDTGWRLTNRLRVPGRRVPLGGGIVPAAVAPGAFLTETVADWYAEELFPDRAALVAGIAAASQQLAADLKDAAGDRWPAPPRRRR